MKTRFVRDEAATDDFFGGHGRVADTLVSLVDHPDRPRLIGLLGSWGSGKSTVLKIAEDKLISTERKTETIVFTFDAWMHQSDPPRRAFIEAFIEFLKQRDICPGEDWAKELSDVQRRNETHEIESTPVLSQWWVAIAMSLLALPLGVRLSGQQGAIGWLGWALVALPFSIAAANWWWWRPDRNFTDITWFFRKENLTTNRPPYEGRSITSIFVSKSTDKTINRVLKSPEPTSIEFRQTFSKILEKIARREAKFVFVLDNLDRIAPDDALIIWSTFRSLFAATGGVADKVGLQFSVVIPLDYFSLRKIYNSAKDENPDEISERIQSLVDKSFDVVLRVGPPVRSDWANYLHEKLKYIFYGKIDDRKLYEATTIYQSSLERKSRTGRVTPRDINSYVNAVSVIWSQRHGEVSFAAACYFACFSAQGAEFDVGTILDTDAPGLAVISRLDGDWQAGVSALHFGVPIERALQLLVGDQLIAAITNEQPEAFKKMIGVPGFLGVLEQILRSEQPRPASFYAALAGLLPTDLDSDVIGQEIWTIILDHALPANGWDKLSELTAEGLAHISRRGDASTTVKLIIGLSRDGQEFEQEPGVWLKNVTAVVGATDSGHSALDRLFVPYDAEYYLASLAAAASNGVDQSVVTHLRPRASPASVVEQLVTTLRAQSFSDTSLESLAQLMSVKTQWPWEALTAASTQVLSDDDSYDAMMGALKALLMIGKDGVDTIQALGASGHLANVFQEAWADDVEDLLAVTVGAIALAWTDLSSAAQFGESQAGEQVLRNLDALDEGQRIRFKGAVHEALAGRTAVMGTKLLEWARTHPQSQATIYSILKSAFEAGRMNLIYSADFAGEASHILRTGNADGREIVRRASFYDTFWKHAVANLPLAELAEIILVPGVAEIADSEIDELSKRVASESEAYWLEAIKGEPNTLKMLDRLLERGKPLSTGRNLHRAYDTHIAQVADGSAANVSVSISWTRLIGAAEPADVNESISKLLDILVAQDNGGRRRIFDVLGDDFLAEKNVVAHGDRFANVLLIPLLVDEDGEQPRAILDRVDAISPLAKRFKKVTRGEVRAKLERLVTRGLLSTDESQLVREKWRLDEQPPRAKPKASRAKATPKGKTGPRKARAAE